MRQKYAKGNRDLYFWHGFTQVRKLQYEKMLHYTLYCSCLCVSYTHNSVRFQVTIVEILTLGIVAVTKNGV